MAGLRKTLENFNFIAICDWLALAIFPPIHGISPLEIPIDMQITILKPPISSPHPLFYLQTQVILFRKPSQWAQNPKRRKLVHKSVNPYPLCSVSRVSHIAPSYARTVASVLSRVRATITASEENLVCCVWSINAANSSKIVGVRVNVRGGQERSPLTVHVRRERGLTYRYLL